MAETQKSMVIVPIETLSIRGVNYGTLKSNSPCCLQIYQREDGELSVLGFGSSKSSLILATVASEF